MIAPLNIFAKNCSLRTILIRFHFIQQYIHCLTFVLIVLLTARPLIGQTVIGKISKPGLKPWGLAIYEKENKLFVADEATGHLLVYDGNSFTQLAEIAIDGGASDALIVAESSGKVYIPTFPQGHHIAVIDARSLKLIHYINADTYGLDIDESIKRVYGISTIAPFYLISIDIDTDSYQTIPLSNAGLTSGLGVNPVTHEIFVGYLQGNALDIINGINLKMTTVHGENCRDLIVNWIENKIYRTTGAWNGYWIYDRDTGKSVITPCINDATSLFFNPKSNRVYSDSEVNNEFTIIEGASDSCYQVEMMSALKVAFRYATDHVYFIGNTSIKIFDELNGTIRELTVDNKKPSSAMAQAVAIHQETGKVYVTNDAEAFNSIIVVQDPSPEPDIQVEPDSLVFASNHNQTANNRSIDSSNVPLFEDSTLSTVHSPAQFSFCESSKQGYSLKAVGYIDTLIYDDNLPEKYSFINFQNERQAVRMSSTDSCKIIAIQIYTPELTQSFTVELYRWAEFFPGERIFETEIVTTNNQGWHTIDISNKNVNVSGDFLAAMKSTLSFVLVGHDKSDNGRSWYYDTEKWNPVKGTDFIRAIVEYKKGLSGTTANLIIRNRGKKDLNIRSITSDQPWICEITPATAGLSMYQAAYIRIKASSTGLANGVYFGALQISSNDPDENPYFVPIKFTVTQSSAVVNTPTVSPGTCMLMQNYPNPFNAVTTIEFVISQTDKVTLKIFNLRGEEIATLLSENLSPRSYSIKWLAGNVGSGVYFCRLQGGTFQETRKLILLQ